MVQSTNVAQANGKLSDLQASLQSCCCQPVSPEEPKNLRLARCKCRGATGMACSAKTTHPPPQDITRPDTFGSSVRRRYTTSPASKRQLFSFLTFSRKQVEVEAGRRCLTPPWQASPAGTRDRMASSLIKMVFNAQPGGLVGDRTCLPSASVLLPARQFAACTVRNSVEQIQVKRVVT